MGVRSTVVTVGTTPTQLAPGSDADNPGWRDLAVKNISSVEVRVGPPDVTPTTGFPLGPGETMSFDDLQPWDLPFAVVASGTATVAVLEVGV